MPSSKSSGSNPVTTIGTLYFSAIGKYSSKPMTVQTCPAARNPCTTHRSDESSASMAGGTSTCETRIEKFSTPSCSACQTDIALAGAVVSNPTAKKTTCFCGLAFQLQRIQGRVHYANVAALGLYVEQAFRRAGHAQHVAER